MIASSRPKRPLALRPPDATVSGVIARDADRTNDWPPLPEAADGTAEIRTFYGYNKTESTRDGTTHAPRMVRPINDIHI